MRAFGGVRARLAARVCRSIAASCSGSRISRSKTSKSGAPTRSTVIRAGRRSCSSSWATIARSATSTCPGLIELDRQYRKKGVVFLGINSNAHETEQDVAQFVADRGIDFPVLKDPENLVADSALVERTCEVIVLDGFARIRYRGAIDDQYQQGKGKDAPDHTYLRDALTALLTNQTDQGAGHQGRRLPDRPGRPEAGRAGEALRGSARPRPRWRVCWRLATKEHPVEVGKVSYAADVAEIIQNKCQTCHRPGQVGPFSLLTYDDARKHSAMIREVVDERRMPPWHADPRYGHFVNDRSLSAKERATLLAWVDQGAPLGDPKQLPAPRTFSEGWTIGKPDVVFELPETYYVPAQGVVSYVYFRVPTNFKEDMWVQAAEAVPGDRSVVHHIIVYVNDPKAAERARRAAAADALHRLCTRRCPVGLPRGDRQANPGRLPTSCSRSTTRRSAVKTDRSKVGLVFSKTKPDPRGVHDRYRQPRPACSRPARDNVAVASSMVLPSNARLVSFLPHMHLRGKDFKFTITKPRRITPDRPVGAGLRLRLADVLRSHRADEPAQGDSHRLPGPLRQLREQPL